MTLGPRRSLTAAATAAIIVLAASAGLAQRIWFGGYGYTPPRFPTKHSFKGSFNFCRAMFESNRREKRGWSTDYPGADLNFSTRLAELTKAPVTLRPDADEDEAADAVVVRLTDDALFKCPFILMVDAGTASFSAEEARRLREYLLKGGFVFASDYWGDWAKEQFDEQIGLALPSGQYPIIDPAQPFDLAHVVRRETRPADAVHSVLAPKRRQYGPRRRRSAFSARHCRRARPDHGRDDAQHRHSRRLGARRRGPQYFFRLT